PPVLLRDRDPAGFSECLHSRPGPALPLVRALVMRYAHEAAGDTKRRGCMMANAAAERLPADRLVARRAEMAWDGLEAALATALQRAQAQGELSAEKDPRSLARFFLVFLQGLKLVQDAVAAGAVLRRSQRGPQPAGLSRLSG